MQLEKTCDALCSNLVVGLFVLNGKKFLKILNPKIIAFGCVNFNIQARSAIFGQIR